MPIYEYRCGSCGVELEKLQKISEPALKDCPSCRKPSLTKLISASSFRLKGTGWYETDFKNSSKKAENSGKDEKDDKGDKGEKTDQAEKAGKDGKDGKSGDKEKGVGKETGKGKGKTEGGSGGKTKKAAEGK